MAALEVLADGISHSVVKYVCGSPVQSLLGLIASICVFTRIFTGFQTAKSRKQVDRTRRATLIPYWIPFVGSALSFMTDIQGTIAKSRYVSGAQPMNPGACN